MDRRMMVGCGLAMLAAAALAVAPAHAAYAGADVQAGGARYALTVGNDMAGYTIMEELAFVDGVFVVPGGEQLRLFYRDTVYAPKRLAAMQPDNGAGQVSGDKAQSIGKAGDLKAGRPAGVSSGTPGAKTIDAGKPTSWLRRVGPWLFGPPRPA